MAASNSDSKVLQQGPLLITDEQRERMASNRENALERLARNKGSAKSLDVASTARNHPNSVLPYGTTSQGQDTLKTIFSLASSTRFCVSSPYDKNLTCLYQKMPSKCYDASTKSWNFSLKDFNVLVTAIRNECSFVSMDLIPRAVVVAFLAPPPQCSELQQLKIFGCLEPKLTQGLMKFQREAVVFAIQRGGRALLADDMGLGKTVEAIAIANYYQREWPVLVICPSSLRMVWAQSFQYWLPSLEASNVGVVFSSSGHTVQSLLAFRVIIVSYELVVKMAESLKACKFKVVIADESHFLKNFKTVRCKSTLPLIKAAQRTLLLSGTPALSRPLELFTQLNAIDKTLSLTYVEFGLRYCNGKNTPFGWDFTGSSHMAELQMYLEEKIMIRRLKQNVLEQLPKKTRQLVALEHLIHNGKELKQMKVHLDQAASLKHLEQRGNLLALYEWTAQLKLPAVQEYVLEKIDKGQKLIVFAHHRVMIDSLAASLASKNVPYICIDGRTAPQGRQELCDRFQHDPSYLIALLSITTASTGLTLTAASTVVFAELFWNPGVLIQAEDRAHRIGQQQSVNVYYLIAKGTVDDFIWPVVKDKLYVLSKAGLATDDFSAIESVTASDSRS